MQNKKLLLAACAAMSIGLLFGGNGNGVTKALAATRTQIITLPTNTEANYYLTQDGNEFITSSYLKMITIATHNVTAKNDMHMVKLPKGIEGMKAETKANHKLEALIQKEYQIPNKYLDNTSYYYNYVDLNDDGKQEIFVVIKGSYTSGTGGDSALLVSQSKGKLYVNQRFTLVNAPVIISNHKTNGLHDLIVPFNGGGAKSQFKVLKAGETGYSDINDSKSIKSLEGIRGKAIIANNILREKQNGHSGITLKARTAEVKKVRHNYKLPRGIERIKAETKINSKLEALIRREYQIPNDYEGETSYHYNYVDLNDDGKQEIFVLIDGAYTSGTGGSSALLVSQSEGKLYVDQKFTLVNLPVIISDHKTNGLHDIIVAYSGGGAKSQYKVLTAGETGYSDINDSKSLQSLDGVRGKLLFPSNY